MIITQQVLDELNDHYTATGLSEGTMKEYQTQGKSMLHKSITQNTMDNLFKKGRPSATKLAVIRHVIERYELEIRIPKRKGRRKRKRLSYFTPAEMAEIYRQTAEEQPYNIIIRLMYECGLRVSEAVNILKYDRVNNKVFGQGKGNKDFEYTIKPKTCRLIHDHFLFNGYKKRPLGFETKDDRKHMWYYMKKRIPEILPHKLIEDIHPHAFRHTTAMHMKGKDFDLVDIQIFMRHDDLRSMHHYVQADKAKVEAKWLDHLTGKNDEE